MPDGSRAPAETVLPHNIEAEQGLLGALLITNEVADQLSGLDAAHFFDPVHGEIYETAMRLIGQGRHASPISVKTLLHGHEGLAALGGPDYLARLAEAAFSIASAPHYAASIREMASRRAIIETAEQMQARAAGDYGASMDDILDGADRGITELRHAVGDTRLVLPFNDVLEDAARWANDAYQREGRPQISTGLDRLDALIGGLQRGRLYLLIGTSSMGKSGLGIEIASALPRQGLGVLFASFEMPGAEIGHRMVSAHMARSGTIVSHFDISRGRMKEEQFRAYLQASQELRRLPFLTAEDNTLEIGRLRAAVMRAKKKLARTETPLGAIVVDYLQLIKVAGAKERVNEVGHAVRELKQWAKELDLPVIALAQAKPEVEDRRNKRPGKRDIQWASEAHQAADTVIAVYRHDYYLAQQIKETDEGEERSRLIREMADCEGAVELVVSKQRGGPIGTALVWCDLATNRFSDEKISDAPPAPADMDEFAF